MHRVDNKSGYHIEVDFYKRADILWIWDVLILTEIVDMVTKKVFVIPQRGAYIRQGHRSVDHLSFLHTSITCPVTGMPFCSFQIGSHWTVSQNTPKNICLFTLTVLVKRINEQDWQLHTDIFSKIHYLRDAVNSLLLVDSRPLFNGLRGQNSSIRSFKKSLMSFGLSLPT